MLNDDSHVPYPNPDSQKAMLRMRCVRKRSAGTFMGLPWFEIAIGPDFEKGELRGHAKAIIAIGDLATGWLAIGGLARGGLAIGGCALGVVAIGGAALGALAFGGAALGVVAVGGGAVGYFAAGGGAFGAHVVSGARQDPDFLESLKSLFPH